MTPVAVKEVASKPVAVLLWSRAVTPTPVKKARKRLLRFRPSQRRKTVPKPRCTPVPTMCVPQRRRPT